MPTTASNPSEQRGRLLAGPFKQRVVAQELKINSLNFYENTEPQGGFTKGEKPVMPVIRGGAYGYEHVNVADQRRNPEDDSCRR